MMKVFSYLPLLFTLLLLSCGQKKSSNVNLELRGSLIFGGATLAPYSTGGLMLWGKAQTGEAFAKVLRDSETFSVDLPNGEWSFYAMAWESSAANELQADTALRCAQASSTLSGGDLRIALNLNSATCNTNDIFRGDLTDLQQMQLALHSCEDVTPFNTLADRCGSNRAAPDYVADNVPVMSALITLESYSEGLTLPTDAGLSRCVSFPVINQSYAPGAPSDIVIPQGSSSNPGAHPFRVSIKYDLSSNTCSSPPEQLVSGSLTGISQVARADLKVLKAGNIVAIAQAFNDQQICAGKENLDPFAGGDGSAEFPYLICSGPQLYNMHDLPVYLSSSFKLGTSINLFNFMKGSNVDLASVPADFNCWDFGQTWQPLGLTYTDCNTPVTGTDSFTGNFDGNGHTIGGLNMRYESLMHIGFISRWEANTTGAYIRDLNFKNAEVSAASAVGVLFGSRGFPNDVMVSGIEIREAEVEARDQITADAGGLFGFGVNVELKNIRVLETTVKYEGNSAGGVFGRITQSLGVSKIYSAAHLIPRYRNPNVAIQNVGGIGGSLTSGIIALNGLSELAHEGIVESIALYSGGLFGSLSSNQPLNYFYVNSALMGSTDNSHSLGGIVGRINNTMTIGKGYFSGSLMDRCLTTCSRGLIFGSKDGAAIVTGQDLFAYSANQPPTIVGDAFDLAYLPDSLPNANSAGSLYDPAAVTNLSVPFISVAGALPRLPVDKHPCLENTSVGVVGSMSLSTQVGLGLGSATNPVRICRKDQFEELGAMPAVQARIFGGVNLAGTYTSPTVPANVVVDGKPGFVFGYFKEDAITAGTDVFAIVNENYGTLKNIKLGNISSNVLSAGLPGYSAGFVKNNLNVIDNVKFLSGLIQSQVTSGLIKSAGLVSFNSGTIKNSSMKAHLHSPRNLAGFVTNNDGDIKDNYIEPTIVVNQASQSITGVVSNNSATGSISRIYLGGALESTSMITNIFLVADTNSGLIEDIEIGSDLRWLSPIANAPYALVVNQSISGAINRVIMKGQFLNTDITTDAFSPVHGNFTVTTGGTRSGIYSFSPIGRKIYEDQSINHTCTGNIFEIDSISYGSVTGPFALAGAYFVNDSSIGGAKHVWLVVENNGQRNAALVTGLSNTNPITLNLNDDCDLIGFNNPNARFTLVQSYDNTAFDATGDIFTFPNNGVITLHDFDSTSLMTTPWSASFLDPANSVSDMDLIMDYFMAELLGLPPVAIPPWELEETRGPSLLTIRR